MRLKTTHPELVDLIRILRKKSRETKAEVWRDVADRLNKPGGGRVVVNVGRINRHTEANKTVIVPGKVLGAGRMDHPVCVAAFKFSKQAEEKILGARGSCLTLEGLLKKSPKGSNVKILG